MTTAFSAYLPCTEAEKVIAEKGYDPLRDLANSPDSVFCSLQSTVCDTELLHRVRSLRNIACMSRALRSPLKRKAREVH